MRKITAHSKYFSQSLTKQNCIAPIRWQEMCQNVLSFTLPFSQTQTWPVLLRDVPSIKRVSPWNEAAVLTSTQQKTSKQVKTLQQPHLQADLGPRGILCSFPSTGGCTSPVPYLSFNARADVHGWGPWQDSTSAWSRMVSQEHVHGNSLWWSNYGRAGHTVSTRRVRKTCCRVSFGTQLVCVWEKTVLELDWSQPEAPRLKYSAVSQKACKVISAKSAKSRGIWNFFLVSRTLQEHLCLGNQTISAM